MDLLYTNHSSEVFNILCWSLTCLNSTHALPSTMLGLMFYQLFWYLPTFCSDRQGDFSNFSRETLFVVSFLKLKYSDIWIYIKMNKQLHFQGNLLKQKVLFFGKATREKDHRSIIKRQVRYVSTHRHHIDPCPLYKDNLDRLKKGHAIIISFEYLLL